MSDNADALATVFRDRSPWCNYEPALPFSDESIRTAARFGDTVYLNGYCPSGLRLHSLMDASGALFTKLCCMCSCNGYRCVSNIIADYPTPHMFMSKDGLSLNESSPSPNDLRSALITIECLRIASRTGNTVELEEVDLSSLTNLRSLHIEERCFLFAKRFIVHDLQFLKSIHIERYCFVVNCEAVPDSLLSIKDCPQLESIHIGSVCFYSYSSMELESEWRVEGLME